MTEPETTGPRIRTRADLLHHLTEAAEVEHNLMCTYLYAVFGLKRSTDEGLSDEEAQFVEAWRATIMGVAIEEMTHLALVSNLFCALGARPHFARPNFPVYPGTHPADIVVRLTPFDLDTLDHFIFLERPFGSDVRDSPAFASDLSFERGAVVEGVMPTLSDYATVGELYAAIREALERLAREHGEHGLFVGGPAYQVGPDLAALPGLTVIDDLASARRALDTIVEQGEGSSGDHDYSHFERFRAIRPRYEELLVANPAFAPSRPVAVNPVMRRPADPEGRVFVDAPEAAALVDLGNALYSEMVRSLSQAFGRADGGSERKADFLALSVDLMHALMPLAEELTRLPASTTQPGINAGLTFATLKDAATPIEGDAERIIAAERIRELAVRADTLAKGRPALAYLPLKLHGIATAFRSGRRTPQTRRADASPGADDGEPRPEADDVLRAEALRRAIRDAAGTGDRAEGRDITLFFNGGRCIHSRFCVLRQPQVYRANVEGDWIDADADSVENSTAIAHHCPSGAITYARRDGATEQAPRVNTVGPRENGPLAFRGDLRIFGEPIGYRVVLCRCGRSGNKPFCDNSHIEAGFMASGEGKPRPHEPHDDRDGPVEIVPQRNGPLRVDGNLEVVSGTQHPLQNTRQVRLCRCGHSRSKPFCDGSHVAAGFVSDGV